MTVRSTSRSRTANLSTSYLQTHAFAALLRYVAGRLGRMQCGMQSHLTSSKARGCAWPRRHEDVIPSEKWLWLGLPMSAKCASCIRWQNCADNLPSARTRTLPLSALVCHGLRLTGADLRLSALFWRDPLSRWCRRKWLILAECYRSMPYALNKAAARRLTPLRPALPT